MFKRQKMINGRDESSITPALISQGPFTIEDFEGGLQNLEQLHSKKILVLGAGGLGCEILKNMALSGFKHIDVIDMDTIDISNLNRQFLFRTKDIGKSKAIVACEFIRKRVKDVNVTPHFAKIQTMGDDFFKQFDLIISGLDNIEARRWVNSLVISLYDVNDDDSLIPMIDGGTEGFRGQSRVIFPRLTACYECTLSLAPAVKTQYPVCTIANTPRLPEHCIEYVNLIEWPKQFPDKKFDADNPDDVTWLYDRSLDRAKQFNISGVTRSLALGVVKNIIPAIASTNAIIAASCVNEAFKVLTSCNPNLEYCMQYSGDNEPFTFNFAPEQQADCPICG
ncbi:NEDD8-activating protein [Saccharomycopsis crataegensis]|uniref:NEDD8-activating enzyme E1 catalytic subunit n=1 Tax=Saccharomycopsis crataegensis TaxID=43959 RepID=A0AAV5QY05_9ASCO|nr:NEDD8-activating protein [Saccharomycopsis crataegensis]